MHLLLVVAGAVSGLALPPVGAWWVLFFTVPILLWRVEATTQWRGRFMVGLAFGFGYFCAAFQWIGFAFFVHAADIWMMPFAVGGLALFMACYWGLALVAARLFPARLLPCWLTSLVLLTAAEWLRGRLFTGFPWAVPGLAADGMGGVVQLASVVGMTGLTALVLVWSALPVLLWQRRARGLGALLAPMVVLAGLPLAHVWGEWRLAQTPTQFHQTAVARLVQPNIAQDDKWRSDHAAAIFETLMKLSQAAPSAAPITHIIWPESAVPFLLDEDEVALARIAAALDPGQTLLAGSIRRENLQPNCASCPDSYFTSILTIDHTGIVTSNYDKWRLVPGGEYLPLEDLLSKIGFRKVVSLPESFSQGPGPGSVFLPDLGFAGLLICYEVIFPHQLVGEPRPNLLVNATNDGWFGRSSGPYQHLAQARLRSIEQGLPLLRAANTGISAVIDPVGRITVRTLLGDAIFIDSPVPLPVDQPVYARWGDITLLAVLALLVLILNGTHWLAQPSHRPA